jgi:hypothetical protein
MIMNSMKCSIHGGNGRSSQIRAALKMSTLPAIDFPSKNHLTRLGTLDRVPVSILGRRCNTESWEAADGIGSTEMVCISKTGIAPRGVVANPATLRALASSDEATEVADRALVVEGRCLRWVCFRFS